MKLRIGSGIDFHQLEKSIPLIIGGVSIPFEKGSKGHSDGDVLFHAVVDAILGALSLGDIGKYFPSNDPRWKDADSRHFLEYVCKLIEKEGYSIENIDATIILEHPVLKPHIINMRNNTAFALSIDLDQVSIKSTTTDKLGFIGKSEGIAATASVLLRK
jgi:2-C-methyl-D-erythritol 2,4-cyclodiphosphate synthase